jgi:serine/threonine protein kinase
MVLSLLSCAVHGGTHIYSAPEQLLGTRCGPPTDIFSLGLIMLEVVAGMPASGRTFRFDNKIR